MKDREDARKLGHKIYRDESGVIRHVSNNHRVTKKDPNRAIAREVGLPYYWHSDGTLRSVRTNGVVNNPRWAYHSRQPSPTYSSRCPKHGFVKFWRTRRRCARCRPKDGS